MAKASRACAFALVLRLLAMAATLCATIVMASSHETITIFGLTLSAKFQYTPTFVFFVIANAIAAVYTLFTLFVPISSALSRPMVVLDVVIAMLLVAAVAAGSAVGEVGKKGNKHAGWLPICGQVPKFCDQVTGAMICGFVSVGLYFVIVLHSMYTVLFP